MKGCKNPGKTALLAWLILNFLATRPHAKLAVTSITGPNLADNLWPELSKWMERSAWLKEAFTWTKKRVFSNDHPGDWFASARTWRKDADHDSQADTLAGTHADYVMFVLDEAGGIPAAVVATALAGLGSGIEAKIVMAGNPTNVEGPFYDACTKHRDRWWVKEITGDPDDPNRAPRVDIQWARDQISEFGRDNPWVLVNVFGRFPPSSINSLLGPDEVRDAMARSPKVEDFDMAQRRLGVDVARFGDDSTVIFPRQGIISYKPVVMRSARTNDIAGRIVAIKMKWKSEMEMVDDTGGWGGGVIDNMIQFGYDPIPVNASGKAGDPRYYNKRSECWWEMAQWIKRGGALPQDDELLKELTTPTYTLDKGKLRVESKEQLKKRLGFSPDKADALAQTFAIPEMPKSQSIPGMQDPGRAQVEHEFDPFA